MIPDKIMKVDTHTKEWKIWKEEVNVQYDMDGASADRSGRPLTASLSGQGSTLETQTRDLYTFVNSMYTIMNITIENGRIK